MLRNAVCSAIASLSIAVLSSVANCELIGTFGPSDVVSVSASSQPTEGLDGYTTWTLTLGAPIPILSLDFYNVANDYGIFGTFNQIYLFGLPTPYRHTFLDGGFPDLTLIPKDTHFLPSNPPAVVGFCTDSSTELRCGIGRTTPLLTLPVNLELAQLVVPNGSPVSFRGTVTYGFLDPFGNASDPLVVEVSGTLPTVPEPTTILVAFGFLGALSLTRASRRHNLKAWDHSSGRLRTWADGAA